MSRLQELLQDLRTMPGMEGAFLCCREGVIATTLNDAAKQKRVGRVYLNILSGGFSLGHSIQEVYCSFNNAVLMVRPVSRGCILVAKCKPGVTIRLVDISLTMTAKSIEEELNSMDELPPPIDRRGPVSGPAEPADDGAGAIRDSEVGEPVETRTEG